MLVASITLSYTENNYAFLKAFFMDGKKVHKGNIFVGGKDVYKLLEWETDEEGLFWVIAMYKNLGELPGGAVKAPAHKM